MHELGIAQEILEVAVAEGAKHGAEKVTRVTLSVGVLRGVVPETLSFLFSHVAAGTMADGAALEVTEEPVTVACETCGPREAREFVLSCPACGSDAVALSGGEALRIVSLEIEP